MTIGFLAQWMVCVYRSANFLDVKTVLVAKKYLSPSKQAIKNCSGFIWSHFGHLKHTGCPCIHRDSLIVCPSLLGTLQQATTPSVAMLIIFTTARGSEDFSRRYPFSFSAHPDDSHFTPLDT